MGDTFFTNRGFKISDGRPWMFIHPAYNGALHTTDLHDFTCVGDSKLVDFVSALIFEGKLDWFMEARQQALAAGFVFEKFIMGRFDGIRFARAGVPLTIWQHSSVCMYDHGFYNSVPEYLASLA